MILGCGAAIAGLAAAQWIAPRGEQTHAVFLYSVAALVLGLAVAIWILGVGFGFEDARQRAMRPVLWLLVVILLPHLLGFLLYFALRLPLAWRCGYCGQNVSPSQRFCSWCGASQISSTSPHVPLTGTSTHEGANS